MNSLFSEFFNEFAGAILGVCDTIWILFGGHLGGILKGFRGESYSTSKIKQPKLYFFLLKPAPDGLFIRGSMSFVSVLICLTVFCE